MNEICARCQAKLKPTENNGVCDECKSENTQIEELDRNIGLALIQKIVA